MSLSFDLNEAIVKNLPAQMSKVLQDRLALVDELERKYNDLVKANEANIKVMNELRLRDKRAEDILSRESLLVHNEAILKEEQWKLKVVAAKLEGRDLARQDNLEVVRAVFANSKLKYIHQDNANGFANGQSTNASHIVTGEREV